MGDAELRTKLVQSRALGKLLWATGATATWKPEPRGSGARALSSVGPHAPERATQAAPWLLKPKGQP